MATVTLKQQPILKGNYMDAHENKICFIDLDTGESLGLMGLPRELKMRPESTFATIKPYGRNNPKYHFTGSEDTMEIEISWWSAEEDRTDVISRCKWLEAMSKPDGYLNRQHYVHFMFGTLFSKAQWLIQSAEYTLTDFNKEKGMRPTHATQTVILKRVTENNRTTEQIVDWRS